MYQKVREEVDVTPLEGEFRGATVALIGLVGHQRRLLAGHPGLGLGLGLGSGKGNGQGQQHLG